MEPDLWCWHYEYDYRCCRMGMQSAASKIEDRYSARAAAAKSHAVCHGALVQSSRVAACRNPTDSALGAATTTTMDTIKVRRRAAGWTSRRTDGRQRTRGMASEQTKAAVLQVCTSAIHVRTTSSLVLNRRIQRLHDENHSEASEAYCSVRTSSHSFVSRTPVNTAKQLIVSFQL